jgi:hypothetical protein
MRVSIGAVTVRTHYETLRREATGAPTEGARSHGLALFLLRGMSAWLQALAALGSLEAASCPSANVPDDRRRAPLPGTRAELMSVLAGMVLACLREDGVAS